MRIADSAVRLAASATSRQSTERREELRVWTRQGGVRSLPSGDLAVISAEARARAATALPDTVSRQRDHAPVTPEVPPLPCCGDGQMTLMAAVVQKVFGVRVDFFDAADLSGADVEPSERAADPGDRVVAPQDGEGASVGWGVHYRFEEITVVEEQAQVRAEGSVRTEDGRSIDFQAELRLEHRQVSIISFEVQAGDVAALVDPLVLTFGGGSATLGDDVVDFDLDADGEQDRISFVGPGSGFLVIDRDADGEVDDGRELFGPRTGDGFAELAAHDDDGNGWIDEADGVYAKLGVWTRDGGHERLLGLTAAGVGAIYLGHASTPLTLTDSAGAERGRLQSTGVFLHEDGRLGKIQHVDLVSGVAGDDASE